MSFAHRLLIRRRIDFARCVLYSSRPFRRSGQKLVRRGSARNHDPQQGQPPIGHTTLSQGKAVTEPKPLPLLAGLGELTRDKDLL